jgi:hypothetical protein
LTAYAVNDVVSSGGTSYIAIAAGTNFPPATSPTKWSVMAQQGATGSTGATGATGAAGTFSTANVAVRTATMDGTGVTGTVTCNAGEKALGGGFNLTTTGNIRVTQSAPTVSGTTPNGWSVTYSSAAAGTVYAICAS